MSLSRTARIKQFLRNLRPVSLELCAYFNERTLDSFREPNEWSPAVSPRRHGGNVERIEINWSVEALSNRAVDGEPGTPKRFSTRSSDQAVLHEGKNLEFLAHLTTETLFDGTLGPLK
jgi:hypothetical protein